MTQYQLVQARLTKEAAIRLCEHFKIHGKDASVPTYMRGFVEGGMFALMVCELLVEPAKRPKPKRGCK